MGPSSVGFLLKHTFFGHFCAGESDRTIKPTLSRLHDHGIGGILDYAAEADLTPSAPPPPLQPATKHSLQARVYDYAGEAECDKNCMIFRSCIEAVHNTTPDGFAAIKVSALGQPLVLERMSTAIVETRKLFSRFDVEKTGKISEEVFRNVYRSVFTDTSDAEIHDIFNNFRDPQTGFIDYIEWTNTIKVEKIWELVNRSLPGPLTTAILTPEETHLMHAMLARLSSLAEHAARLSVRLMIDAEQTYFQPAIDHLALALQRTHNRKFPTIFNTYQCYLKDSYERVVLDLERAKREKYWFATKVVRGAYLVLERRRAAEMGYEDPLQPNIEETHKNYHRVVDLLLRNNSNANVLVASHNQDSIIYTLRAMEQLGIPKGKESGVYFGQLLGMADHLTYNLGRNGYYAYKYVPYGPVKEVVPYLIRRAQENSNILGGVSTELKMLSSELKRRLTFGFWKH
uniref:Proline dehydrogenase n=1 Tax=Arcella intermedia TaxID=1963864 RepID=A0A6B2L295_9EUKA